MQNTVETPTEYRDSQAAERGEIKWQTRQDTLPLEVARALDQIKTAHSTLNTWAQGLPL